MATAFQAVGAIATNATTVTLPVVAPALIADDIMVACLINKALSNVITPQDASWTEIVQDSTDCTTAADDHRFAVYWKRAVTGDSGATFNFTKTTDDNQLFAGCIATFRGCPTSGTPLDPTAVGVTKTAAAADNVSFPAFDPGGTDAHIVYLAFYGNDVTTFAAAMSNDVNPDVTKRWDLETTVGTDCTIACTTGNTTNGASIAARTWASVASIDAGSSGVVFGLRTATANPARTPTVGGGLLTGIMGAVFMGAVLTPAVGTLAVTGQEPSLGARILAPAPGRLFLDQQAWRVTGAGALAVVGQQAVVQPITVGSAVLSLVGAAPALLLPSAVPGTGLLSLDGIAPSRHVDTAREPLVGELWLGLDEEEAAETYAEPSAGALALVGASVMLYPSNATPDLGALMLTGTLAQPVTGARLEPAGMLAEV